jgi:excisionase family DNA binding protein
MSPNSGGSYRLLLKIQEVAQLTGLTVGTLYHFVSQHRIPVVRISSRCIRFRPSDIEAWIANVIENVSGSKR